MRIPESTWRREYRLGGGTKPVRDLRLPNRSLYDAYASYEKGGVENCNRILRRWFPKGTDFSQVSTQRLHQVERLINAMHRASLDGATAEQRDKELRHVA